MSEMQYEKNPPETREETPHKISGKLAIPFFVVLAILTVVAFIIPLRPTVSYAEKRELTKFPECTVDSLLSGDYFEEIGLWFSDTFPGRESWISLANTVDSFHGYSEVAIVEGDFLEEILNPVVEATTTPTQNTPSEPMTESGDDVEIATEDTTEETTPEETQWGGIDAGEDAEISLGAVIQIGDSAFNQIGFSEYVSRRYSAAVSGLADALADKGVQVVSAPPPLSIGILVEPEYQEKLGCARQDEMVEFLHSNMSENVVTVDTYAALVSHNSEYLYFRTDHHWTARGAYYSYVAICEALGQETATLDSFQEVDYGEFRGSLTTRVPYTSKLRSDNVYAYVPAGDITMYNVYDSTLTEFDMFQDMTNRTIYETYLVFLGGDYALQKIVNNSLPEGSTCLVVKDSFGNCFAPFMTQNYHTVYVMDYRKYGNMTIRNFVEKYDVDTVILMPYLMATQANEGAAMFERLCG